MEQGKGLSAVPRRVVVSLVDELDASTSKMSHPCRPSVGDHTNEQVREKKTEKKGRGKKSDELKVKKVTKVTKKKEPCREKKELKKKAAEKQKTVRNNKVVVKKKKRKVAARCDSEEDGEDEEEFKAKKTETKTESNGKRVKIDKSTIDQSNPFRFVDLTSDDDDDNSPSSDLPPPLERSP